MHGRYNNNNEDIIQPPFFESKVGNPTVNVKLSIVLIFMDRVYDLLSDNP
jgi:hypothetical protein